ncbi:MAG: DUF4465 domain-containing protein [Bacteroidales bacterium]|nr:DUF4465 domain-containing protein [Candidatus Physcousia equi]
MKKFYFVAMLLCAGFAFTSCGNDDDTPTPNPEPPTPTPVKPTPKDVTVDFEGDSWAALIDPEQNNGTLLYNESVQYKWSDAKTGLSGWVNGAEDYYHPGTVTYMFWNGGTAISNYVDPAFDTHCSADYQLSVPASNGSKNFVIGFCGWGGPTTITLPEGENRLFKSIDICPTTWLLGSIKGFDGYASKLAEDGSIYLVITGQKAGSTEAAGTVKVAFANENKILDTWKNIDLSSLGEINSITFTIESTDSKQPNYFAFDNVVLAGKAE